MAVLAAACRAVASVHERGVIHRDIKPANILVTPTGEVMIVDFGLAFQQDAPALTISQAGALLGTPAYMAPEQARGERGGISTRTDVYGLGATGYQVLTGDTPHDTHASLAEVVRRVTQDPPREPRTINPELPKPLAAVLSKACQPLPARRYASAAELAGDLERWLRGEPVTAELPGAAQRLARWMYRRPKAVTALACVLCLALAVAMSTVYTWWTLLRPYQVVSVQVYGDPLVRARLLSRSGNILHEWRDHRSGGVTGAHMVKRPPNMGGGSVVVLAYHEADVPGVYVYDVADPKGSPVWTSGYGPGDFTIPALPGLACESYFSALTLAIADVYPSLPGDELIVLHNHGERGVAVVRVYDLAGKVLFEAWHRGHLKWLRWLANGKRLIVGGFNSEANWAQRGNPDTQIQWPVVVFGLDPSGPSGGWIATPTLDGAVRPDFYKCLLPALAYDYYRANREFDIGRPHAGAIGLDRLDLEAHAGVTIGYTTIIIDAKGNEVRRLEWSSTSYADDIRAGAAATARVELGELPPVVAARPEP